MAKWESAPLLEEPKWMEAPLVEQGLPPDPAEEEKQIKETVSVSDDFNIPLSDAQRFVAVEEPSLFGKVLNEIKESIRKRTGYFEPPIYGPKFREEQPLRTAGKMAAYYGAEAASGLTVTALDILANKTMGDKTLADTVARITGYEPTPKEEQAGESAKYIAAFTPVGKVVRAGTKLIPAAQTLKTILSSGLTFASTDAAIQFSKNITEGRPVDWSRVHAAGGVGVLWGTGEVAVAAVLSKIVKGMDKYWGEKGMDVAEKLRPEGTTLKDQYARQQAEIRADINRAKEVFRKTGKMPEDLMKKYVHGKPPEGSAFKPPKPEGVSKPIVKAVSKPVKAKTPAKPITPPAKPPKPAEATVTGIDALQRVGEAQSDVLAAIKKYGYGGITDAEQHPELVKARKVREAAENDLFNNLSSELKIGDEIDGYVLRQAKFDLAQSADTIRATGVPVTFDFAGVEGVNKEGDVRTFYEDRTGSIQSKQLFQEFLKPTKAKKALPAKPPAPAEAKGKGEPKASELKAEGFIPISRDIHQRKLTKGALKGTYLRNPDLPNDGNETPQILRDYPNSAYIRAVSPRIGYEGTPNEFPKWDTGGVSSPGYEVVTKDNNRFFIGFRENDKAISIPEYAVRDKNTGEGSKFINYLKEYADKTGKTLRIDRVAIGVKFWDKLDFLKKKDEMTYEYNPQATPTPKPAKAGEAGKGEVEIWEKTKEEYHRPPKQQITEKDIEVEHFVKAEVKGKIGGTKSEVYKVHLPNGRVLSIVRNGREWGISGYGLNDANYGGDEFGLVYSDTSRKKQVQKIIDAYNAGYLRPEGTTHISAVRTALAEGKSVPREILEEYKSQKWAQKAMEATPTPPAEAGKGGGNIYKDADTATKEILLKQIYGREGTEVVVDETIRDLYKQLKESFTPEEKEEFKAVTGILDKRIAYAEKQAAKTPPAQPEAINTELTKKSVQATPTPKKEAGFIEVEKTVDALKAPGRWFLSVFEPAKIAARKHGREAAATAIRAIHRPEAQLLEYGAKELEALDMSYNQVEEWIGKYPKEIQEAIMLTRGHGLEDKARALQAKAFASLPKELKDSKVRRALDEIADFNYGYLSEIFGEEVETLFGTDIVNVPGYVRDYFYGVYKNPEKINNFLSFWKTTDKYTKHKVFPTYADAKAYGLEVKDTNPVTNLKAEYKAISYKASMLWLKGEMMRLGEGKYIMPKDDAPIDWEHIGGREYADPTFADVLVEPSMAKLINNLISTNKISQFKPLRMLRDVNNFLRSIKFIGSAFHMVSIAKQSVADSGYLGFYKPTATRGFTTGFSKSDPMFQTPEYKWYIENGGGHKYAIESEARKVFSDTLSKLTKSEQYIVKIGSAPLRLPVGFVDWMFNSYIPKVKYSKYLDVVAGQEKKLDRSLTASETQEIIKEQQNFYGMMNERLYGRSGTVTSILRFVFIAPGYAEGNYRTMLKGTFQWGQGEDGFRAGRSRVNILNSWIVTGTLATVGTLILTGKPPKMPETIEEVRDLLKIDTGKKDKNGQRIMIDLATYDRDYWDVAFNTLRGRPDIAANNAITRIGGMKAPTAKMIADLYDMMQGKTLYDWKDDKVYHITDPFLQKIGKLIAHETKELLPISASVYKQSRTRGIDRATAALETLLGFRPGRTERDKKEFEIVRDIWDMRDKREKLSYKINSYDDPWGAVELYNKTLDDLVDNKFITDELREKIEDLKIDPKKVITWKRFPIEKLTDEQLKISIQEHVYKSHYKDNEGKKHDKGDPHKGWEDRVESMLKELEKRTGSRKFKKIKTD